MMSNAVKETKDMAIKENCSLRMACYANSIIKLHKHFETAGIPLAK